MKTKKKLALNKTTIAALNALQQSRIKTGVSLGDTCITGVDPTVCPSEEGCKTTTININQP